MTKTPRLTKDGTVDRRRPPDHKKFPKGVSGNPLGRPRSRVDSILQQMDEIIDAPVPVTEHGVRKLLSERQIRAKLIANKIAAGEIPAIKELLHILKRCEKTTPISKEIKFVVLPDQRSQ